MKIKDYFKVNFQKPEISDSISKLIKKKTDLKNQLDFCYSRLESVEICNSNSKSADALILANYLIVDILNLSLLYLDKSPISILDNWKVTVQSLPDTKLAESFNNPILVLESNEQEDYKADNVEFSLANLLDSIERYIFKINKLKLQNPVDEFKKKLFIQLAAGIIIVSSILFLGIRKYNEIKPMKNDSAKLYFMNEQSKIPILQNLVTTQVTPSMTWQDVSFVLENPSDVKDIKIEPVHQNKAKIQIKSVKYLDANKNTIYERDFKINAAGIIENTPTNELCCLEDLKIGRLIPGKYLELESTNINPSFYIKVEPLQNVKEIILSLRYIKNVQKFTD
ncbi:MAG: hypothetical protein KBF93_14930 [Leptospiraceae bacterium]|nr:hypothetical protein [Leptospiraceae bacterium]